MLPGHILKLMSQLLQLKSREIEFPFLFILEWTKLIVIVCKESAFAFIFDFIKNMSLEQKEGAQFELRNVKLNQ